MLMFKNVLLTRNESNLLHIVGIIILSLMPRLWFWRSWTNISNVLEEVKVRMRPPACFVTSLEVPTQLKHGTGSTVLSIPRVHK